MLTYWIPYLWGLAVFALQLAGVYYAIQAVMTARTPQSAIGWGLGLLVIPIVTIPMFWVFGETRFVGCVVAGSGENPRLDAAVSKLLEAAVPFADAFSEKHRDIEDIVRAVSGVFTTGGNSLELLIDGESTFSAIFDAMDSANTYVIVQFYIIHDDGLGKELQNHLLSAASRGVKCYVLYDGVGSKGLGEPWIAPLRNAGVKVHSFVTNRQRGYRFQINFRNHRKLVVVDGVSAFLGGINAGDEYLGLGPLGSWRDTHLKVTGPAVVGMLPAFLEDWLFAGQEVLDLPVAPAAAGHSRVLPFASSPSQGWPLAAAAYQEILHDARERIWIASPYFVPDPATRTALAHAALRGVDVRILLPGVADHLMPWLSSFTYYPQMKDAGVRIWRHHPGFMHQKVMLADHNLAIVGSVNLDYRSFMINFEAAAACEDREFALRVEKMLLKDFSDAVEEDLSLFANGSFIFRLKCRLASLMSPEQ